MMTSWLLVFARKHLLGRLLKCIFEVCLIYIQYQQSREGPNCTADLLKISGKIFWWGVVGELLMTQGVLWYFYFFRSFKLVGTIIECDRLLLSRPSGRYWIVLIFLSKIFETHLFHLRWFDRFAIVF